MAEASSSGGEASEEEEDSDEASPSNKRKELRYVQDYLQRLSKHQRKRIQKEVNKGYKPGELDRRYSHNYKLMIWASTAIK